MTMRNEEQKKESDKPSKQPYGESEKTEEKEYATCVIYTRKTAIFGDGNKLNDNDGQRKMCESIINAERKFIISEKRYNDDESDIEGLYRPALTDLINDIKRELVDTVVIYYLDALSTDFKTIGKIMKVFDEHSVRLILAKQWIDSSTPDGRRFFMQIAELVMLEDFAEEREYLNKKLDEDKKNEENSRDEI